MNFEQRLTHALEQGVKIIDNTKFIKEITTGENARSIYIEYLKYAYHYVVKTSSFTPLAARRIDSKHLKMRQWILEHSSEEMGHELMALKDLEKFGFNRDDIINSKVPFGVTAWESFFYYCVDRRNPFTMFGVLYFLEGMATVLAPKVVNAIVSSLGEDEKKAITFFKEHGVLDVDHLAEQKEILLKAKLTQEEQDFVVGTITEAAKMKKFMLDELIDTMS